MFGLNKKQKKQSQQAQDHYLSTINEIGKEYSLSTFDDDTEKLTGIPSGLVVVVYAMALHIKRLEARLDYLERK